MMFVPPSPAPSGQRRIWLCADDYGISASVNAAFRDLISRERINATSVMVVAPSLHRAEAKALAAVNADKPRAAIGLHVTLSAPYRPLATDFRPLREGAFLPLQSVLLKARLNRFRPELLREEIASQLRLFIHSFGRPPDFVDGHQHVQLFPQIRDAFLAAVKELAPQAWVRQCGSLRSPRDHLRDRKGLLLNILSVGFRRRAQALGVRTNPAFAGTYGFNDAADFATLFPYFLDRLPIDSVIMCHPGTVDAELKRLDPLTTLREREYACLKSDAFSGILAAHGVALA
jgi:predicted glycoside hydrolase/deacetylase ChbG (UPF0249 family)